MKIIHAVPYFPPVKRFGGVPEAVYCLAKAQAALGHDVTVLTSDAGLNPSLTHPELKLEWENAGKVNARGTAERLEVYYLKNRWPSLAQRYKIFTFNPRRIDVLQSPKETVLHLHEVHIPGYRALARDAIRKEVPVCLSAHGSLFPPVHTGMKRFIHQLVDPCLRRGWFADVSTYFALSRNEEKQLQKAGVKSKRIQRQPHGIPQFPHPPEPLPFDLPRTPAVTTFLYVGRLAKAKGVLTATDAFCQLWKRGVKARLICCGPDEGAKHEILLHCRSSRIPVQVREAGTEPGVYLLPAVPRACVPALFEVADWSLCPSPYESFGLTLVESLMCGVPVIATSAYGCLDHLSDANNRIKQVSPGDTKRLCTAMIDCLPNEPHIPQEALLPPGKT